MQIFKTTLFLLLIYPGWVFLVGAQSLPNPVIDSITVINGKVNIFWQLQEDPEIYYRIYRWNGTWPLIDSVFYPNHQYIDNTGYNPQNQDSLYAVEAVKDGLNSVWTENRIKPPFLKPVQIQPCITRVTLEWTAYKPFSTRKVIKYQVIARINNSPDFEILVDNIPPDIFIYPDIPVHPEMPYDFAIRAFDDHEPAFSSTSAEQSTTTNPDVVLPQKLTIISAGTSISGSTFINENKIYWEIDPAPDPLMKEYVVWRSTDGANYQKIATVDGSELSYSDEYSDPSNFSYFYKVEAVDQCDFSVIRSEPCKTILLKGEAGEKECNLFWTDFIGPINPVEYYIYLIKDSNPLPGEFQPPITTDNFATISVSNNPDTRLFGFYIQTQPATKDPNGISRSNYITLSPETYLVLPSAFDPQSNKEDNREFKPAYRFSPDNSTYVMVIFNKWGERIFESKDYKVGWDGKLPDGSEAPPDVYAYIVRYQSIIGLIKELKGTVTLIR